ncbi:MAG: hypothetical protein ACYCXW_22765, partial [Solirubrobacteraceae bacterium]
MSAPTAVKLALPAGLLASAVALAALGHFGKGVPRPVITAPVRLTLVSPRPAVRGLPRPARLATSTREGAGPVQVAHVFTQDWLACTYRQGRCARIPGTLPAYATALAGWGSGSLATPAELAARPRVVSVRVIRACRNSATASADYHDGVGGRYQLHINLVLEPTGWDVFDVA